MLAQIGQSGPAFGDDDLDMPEIETEQDHQPVA
jgi:hypothetical protein